MNRDDQNLELLDVLAIVSFAIQMQNQPKIFGMSDLQKGVRKVVDEIHKHLEVQDNKIDKIMEVLKIEDYQETVGNDR